MITGFYNFHLFHLFHTIEVESCQKSLRILDIFLPSQLLSGGSSKSCTEVIVGKVS